MADEQDKGAGTQTATADAGASAGATPKTETYTAADLQREADRRVSDAQKKWRAEQDALIADKTKDAETKLAELQSKAEEAERYAGFIESATAAGIRNVKAAYKVAQGEYIDKRGRFDIDAFRKDNPEFFTPHSSANAGNGTGSVSSPQNDMNAHIRRVAGVM